MAGAGSKQATNKQAEPVSREPFVIKERRGKCAVFGNWEMLPHGNLLSMGSNCYRKAELERLGVFAFSIDSSRWFDAPLTRTWDRKLCTNACREDTRHRWYMCFIGNQTGAKITGPSIGWIRVTRVFQFCSTANSTSVAFVSLLLISTN